MSLALLSNIAATKAQRSIMTAGSQLNTAIERLSSGRRINSAKDDAAGLAISSKMNAHIRSLGTASINTSMATSFLQTADDGYARMQDVLVRLREMAVQGATDGTLTSSDRVALNYEYFEIGSEIDRISDSTTFADNNVFSLAQTGSGEETHTFQVGIFNTDDDRMSVTYSNFHWIGTLRNYDESPQRYIDASLGTLTHSQTAIGVIDEALQWLMSHRHTIGSNLNRLDTTSSNLSGMRMNLSAAHSRITDADTATEMRRMTTSRMLADASVAVLGQANAIPGVILSLLG